MYIQVAQNFQIYCSGGIHHYEFIGITLFIISKSIATVVCYSQVLSYIHETSPLTQAVTFIMLDYKNIVIRWHWTAGLYSHFFGCYQGHFKFQKRSQGKK